MKLNPNASPASSSSSPSRDVVRRTARSGGSAKSPLRPCLRSPNAGPDAITKSPKRCWRGGPRLKQLRASAANLALQGLSDPRDTSSVFGPPLEAAPQKVDSRLPQSLSRCPEVSAIFATLLRQGRNGQTCVPTTPANAFYGNEDNEGHVPFCLLSNQVIKRISMDRIVTPWRRADLNAKRMLSVLQAIAQNKAIPPIKVDAQCHIDDGFHRFFASKLLGYSEIDVVQPRL